MSNGRGHGQEAPSGHSAADADATATVCPNGGYSTASSAESFDTRASPEADGEATVDALGSGTWYRQLLVVAETEYRLAIRGRWAVAMTVIFAAFALGLTTFSGSSVSPEGFERTVASLAVLAVYLVPLVALAFSYDAVVGSEESGWLHTLFALPVDRGLIVLGTAVGRAVVFTSAVAIGFGIAGVLLLREFGLSGFDAYAGFLLATVGVGLAFISVGILVSTLVAEKTHALGLSLLAWAWFVLVHDLIGLGVIAALDLTDTAVSALLLANPTGIFRALVLGSLGAAGDAGFAAILAESGLSTTILLAGLFLWIALPLSLAAVLIRYRRI